ncbi:hypothetical protein ZEAMMB73_Zm00001d046192 [Zea mays]|uniref:Uncharacterized protein n=1 Tax=Zea mays TaxID=4577 RepID=K7VH46_MAIZE|nr:hypothetical protein ZEAMMB73_Zm00001d046192 [Zea mays]
MALLSAAAPISLLALYIVMPLLAPPRSDCCPPYSTSSSSPPPRFWCMLGHHDVPAPVKVRPAAAPWWPSTWSTATTPCRAHLLPPCPSPRSSSGWFITDTGTKPVRLEC